MIAKNNILNRRTVFTGKVAKVSEIDIKFDTGEERTFELVGFHVVTGVSALPILDGKILLIRHYQAGIDDMGYTLPTGGLESSEDPDDRMQLELQEEIGYKAGKLTLMMRMHILPSYIGSEAGYVYLAEKLTPAKLVGDEPYQITQVPVTLSQALDLVQSGEIQDGRTVAAILYYSQFYS